MDPIKVHYSYDTTVKQFISSPIDIGCLKVLENLVFYSLDWDIIVAYPYRTYYNILYGLLGAEHVSPHFGKGVKWDDINVFKDKLLYCEK